MYIVYCSVMYTVHTVYTVHSVHLHHSMYIEQCTLYTNGKSFTVCDVQAQYSVPVYRVNLLLFVVCNRSYRSLVF